MSKKEIVINPALFGVKKNQTRKARPLLTPSTIKKNLMNSIKSKIQTPGSVLGALQDLEDMTRNKVDPITEPHAEEYTEPSVPTFKTPIENEVIKTPDPPYGCIKGGAKPTFRKWNQTSSKRMKTVKQYSSFGRHNNTVRVFIQNDKKKMESEIRALERHDINKVRTYLKNHGLLKVGSTAPDDVLREMYKHSILAGNIYNKNKDVLLHNFMQDK